MAIKYKNKVIRFRNPALQEESLRRYVQVIKDFIDFMESQKVKEFDIDAIGGYLAQKRSANTFNICRQALKQYYMAHYSLSKGKQLEVSEGFKTIKRRRPSSNNVNYLTRDKVDKLVSVATERVACIVQAIFWTGCRATELSNMRLADCQVDTMDPSVIMICIMAKGKKEHWVAMDVGLFKRINSVFKGKVYLFETMSGRKYDRRNISSEITRQAKLKLGMRVGAHTLRHSKAMYLKDIMNLSADLIAKALGHAHVSTTLSFYFHGTPSPAMQGIGRGSFQTSGNRGWTGARASARYKSRGGNAEAGL